MKNIYDCVEQFQKLLNIKYEIIIGHKGKSMHISLTFDKADCFHLMGLQHLTDRPELSGSRDRLFDAIADGMLTPNQVESSDLYYTIANRIDGLPYLEKILDQNDTIFRYISERNPYSKIRADLLLTNPGYPGQYLIFLSKISETDDYCCSSFFTQGSLDYTKGQTRWTLLYKKKSFASSNTEQILYDRLRQVG